MAEDFEKTSQKIAPPFSQGEKFEFWGKRVKKQI
jgi:hypothetical protein